MIVAKEFLIRGMRMLIRRSLIAVGVSGILRNMVFFMANPTPWRRGWPAGYPFQKKV
jgi:hypothetical protein